MLDYEMFSILVSMCSSLDPCVFARVCVQVQDVCTPNTLLPPRPPLHTCRCDACVDAVFTRPTAHCPECGKALRRNQYRLQQFEDSDVEKEVDIRKRILKE